MVEELTSGKDNLLQLIDEYQIPIVTIDKNRKYWLVRTQAGDYYQQFYFDNFIAIGWDEFNDLDKFGSVEKAIMVKEMEITYPDNKKPGLIYSQIYRFLFEMRPGDIVMIPSVNSTHISFGIIETHPFIQTVKETDIEEGACPFQKRRKIKWVKTVSREDLDPYLYRMMQTHLTISNAGEYADAIDRTLHSFYLKDGKAHLVLQVTQTEEIPAIDLIESINNILNIVPFVNDPEDPEKTFDKSVIDLKLRVQSPGVMEFISEVAPWAVIGTGILLNYIVGGNIKAIFTKEQTDIEASSQGLIEKILKFRKHNNEHKLKELELQNKITIEKLKIKTPEETKNLPAGVQEDQ
jgi:restriction system protein